MRKTLLRRRGLTAAASLLGASAMVVGLAGTAGAAQTDGSGTHPSVNFNIFQGGSNTTYLMMTGLANVFNESPGCDLASASGTAQPLDYGCPGIDDAGTSLSTTSAATPVGENGMTPYSTENPFNDILIEEPALGSSNGIQELEDQGTHGTGATSHGSPINVAPLDVARSSRAPATTDDKGLNFVAYAMDGVSWIHWTKVNNKATPSAKIKNLTTSQLTNIWDGTLSCTVKGKSYTNNWICISGGTNAPIDVYMAQSGSGTQATWSTLLGQSGTFPYYTGDFPGCTTPGLPTQNVIFENETESILANNGATPPGCSTAESTADAIFLFSYGKYTQIGAKHLEGTKGAVALGEINGIAVNSTTIANQLPGSAGTPFPGDRLLYNVYSNGSNSNIPASSDASLNVVSEDGFICKPATNSDVDPNTGATYRSEIDSVIESNGFYPLPLGVEDGTYSLNGNSYTETNGGIPNPAWNLLGGSAYDSSVEAGSPYSFPSGDQDTDSSAVSGSYTVGSSTVTASSSNPVGYCLVLSTDGNSNS